MTDPKLFSIRGDAKLGSSVNFRTQLHGDQKVAAADISYAGLMLDALQLGELVQEPYVHRAWFTKRAGSTLDDPLVKTIGAIPLVEKITGRVSILSVTGQEEIDLGVCEIAKIKLTPKQGGLTEMAGQIQTTPTLDERIAELLSRMAGNVIIAINYEHEPQQQEMPIERSATEPDPSYDKPGELTTSDGSTIPLKSGKQVDDELVQRAAEKGVTPEPMGADAKPDDSKEFEQAATAQVNAFKNGRKGPRRIDGRKGAH